MSFSCKPKVAPHPKRSYTHPRDHRHGESQGGKDGPSKSNDFEVEMACDLALHFLKQGCYSQEGDIVVLVSSLTSWGGRGLIVSVPILGMQTCDSAFELMPDNSRRCNRH